MQKPLEEDVILNSVPLKLANVTREKLVELYEMQHLSLRKIAKIYGVSSATVAHQMKLLSINRRLVGGASLANISKLSHISKEEIVRLYEKEGLSLSQLAKYYNVTPDIVVRRMKRLNIPRRLSGGTWFKGKGRLANVTREELDELYNQKGLSVSQIAKIYGVAATQMYKRFQEVNIPRRLIKGNLVWSWNGGRQHCSKGYIAVKINKDDPFYIMADKNGYVKEHRLAMARHLGRPLLRTEIVHHRPDVAKDDNRIEVLYLMPNPSDHNRLSPCSNCELKKEIRLLRWQIKELREALQLKLVE